MTDVQLTDDEMLVLMAVFKGCSSTKKIGEYTKLKQEDIIAALDRLHELEFIKVPVVPMSGAKH